MLICPMETAASWITPVGRDLGRVMSKPPKIEPEFTEEEIAKRRDEALKRLLKMPPKPHDEITGKRKPKKPTAKRKPAK